MEKSSIVPFPPSTSMPVLITSWARTADRYLFRLRAMRRNAPVAASSFLPVSISSTVCTMRIVPESMAAASERIRASLSCTRGK